MVEPSNCGRNAMADSSRRRPRVHWPLQCLSFGLLVYSILLSSAGMAAELHLRFVYDGDPPEPKPIEVTKDVAVCGEFGLVDERLLVNPENNGIKNVVVYVYTGRGGTKLADIPPRNQEVRLTMEQCRFEPHILVAQVGDMLVWESKDPVGHNANFNFFRNPAWGFRPPGGVPLGEPEPAPIPVECNIHPWMRAYLVVLEHPYVGVSDEDGRIEIKGLPDNTDLMFRVFVEAARGSIQHVKVDGMPVKWERNNFTITTSEGVTDYGTVSLPPNTFRLEDAAKSE